MLDETYQQKNDRNFVNYFQIPLLSLHIVNQIFYFRIYSCIYIYIYKIGAAVSMIVQKALAARNMKDVCENKYVQMAQSVGNLSPELQQIINLLGCNTPSR